MQTRRASMSVSEKLHIRCTASQKRSTCRGLFAHILFFHRQAHLSRASQHSITNGGSRVSTTTNSQITFPTTKQQFASSEPKWRHTDPTRIRVVVPLGHPLCPSGRFCSKNVSIHDGGFACEGKCGFDHASLVVATPVTPMEDGVA